MASVVVLFIELGVLKFAFPNNSDYVLNYSLTGLKKIDWNILFFRLSLGAGEEIVKSYFLLFYIYYSKYFTRISDGMTYGIVLALGFSLFENSMYFFKISGMNLNLSQMIAPLATRAIGPLLIHAACAGLVGLYIGRKKFGRSHVPLFSLALVAAILIHVAYDFFILFPKFGFAVSFAVVLAVLFFLEREVSKPESKKVHKAITGVLFPPED